MVLGAFDQVLERRKSGTSLPVRSPAKSVENAAVESGRHSRSQKASSLVGLG